MLSRLAGDALAALGAVGTAALALAASDRSPAARIAAVRALALNEDPAAMPVLNSEYALVVNLVAAGSLGIDIPRGILRQADLIMRPGGDETGAIEVTAEAEDEE